MKPASFETAMSAGTKFTAIFLLLGALSVTACAADSPKTDLERRFTDTVRPFLENHCTTCHGGEKPAAQFDLRGYSNMTSVVKDYRRWALVLDRLTAKEMPPQGAKQPAADVRQKVVDWIEAVRKEEARKSAGDPGIVRRRLSNAEYNYTIRTGQASFRRLAVSVDPGLAGTDNSGELPSMSPVAE
jgi:hypothetical protein